MIVTIMQPAYLPWLGFFDRTVLSDVLVLLDHIQMEKNTKTSFVNRNKVRTPQGGFWLTVPILSKGKCGNMYINQMEIAQDKWNVKHWKTIQNIYSKAPFFKDHRDFFEFFYAQNYTMLHEMLDVQLNYLINQLDIKTKIVKSSELNVPGEKEELILNLCKSLNATDYISGPLGRNYLNTEKFAEENINVIYHDYKHPQYKQMLPGFEPYMSVIDLLFNHGKDSLPILTTDLKLYTANV